MNSGFLNSTLSSRREIIADQKFNFQPFYGILTEMDFFLVSEWYLQLNKAIIHLSDGESGGYLLLLW